MYISQTHVVTESLIQGTPINMSQATKVLGTLLGKSWSIGYNTNYSAVTQALHCLVSASLSRLIFCLSPILFPELTLRISAVP